MRQFTKHLGNGVSCTMTTTKDRPAEKQGHILKVEWNGRPTTDVSRIYAAWMNEVNSALATEWGIELGHVIQLTGDRYEFWKYFPGKPAKCIRFTAPPGAKTFEEAIIKSERIRKLVGATVVKVDGGPE